jgi:hypothetical protein
MQFQQQGMPALAIGCQQNMDRRDAGHKGDFDRNCCDDAETSREGRIKIFESSVLVSYVF